MEADTLRDDPTIPDLAELWRRIPPWHLVKDDNLGRVRPSSAAFDNHPNGSPMSVLLAQEPAICSRFTASMMVKAQRHAGNDS